MEINVLNHTENEVTFVADKITPAFANAIRRTAMFEVPVLAIEDVYFTKNSSALYDEIIAHRLGLIPLKTDLKSYNLSEECSCKGKLCAKCSVKITLKAKGPATVYAGDMKFKDPDVKPVYAQAPIVKLLENQEIAFEATAILGKGKAHVKWCAGHMYYRGYPEFTITKDADTKSAIEKIPEDVLKRDGRELEVKDFTKWNESYEVILRKAGINVKNREDKFIFTLESWGQLKPAEILTEAVGILQGKLKEAKLK
ncbi:MAG: DNA-directed RNA polymerase subunit D [archaeon]